MKQTILLLSVNCDINTWLVNEQWNIQRKINIYKSEFISKSLNNERARLKEWQGHPEECSSAREVFLYRTGRSVWSSLWVRRLAPVSRSDVHPLQASVAAFVWVQTLVHTWCASKSMCCSLRTRSLSALVFLWWRVFRAVQMETCPTSCKRMTVENTPPSPRHPSLSKESSVLHFCTGAFDECRLSVSPLLEQWALCDWLMRVNERLKMVECMEDDLYSVVGFRFSFLQLCF